MGLMKSLFGKKEPSASECYERALDCERRADHARALRALDEAIRLDREYCDAYWVRGMVHLITRNYDQALADLQAAHDLNPPTLDCIGVEFNQEPLRVLRVGPRFTDPRAVALKNRAIQNDMARVYRRKGVAAYDQQNLAEAINEFTNALRHSDEFQNYFERGRAYFCAGQFPEAIADLKTAVALNESGELPPDSPDFSPAEQLAACHYFLGNSYGVTGDNESAVSALTNSLQLLPDNPDVYLDRAQAYRALGDTKRAADDERKAKELGGENPP
jgi:tetratricopeptide (TPR) repeat protein